MGIGRKVIWVQKETSCSYKPGEMQRIFLLQSLNPAENRGALYSEFIPKGFAVYNNLVYGTNCYNCNSCVPLRINAERYAPSRNERILFKHNLNLKVTFSPDDRPIFLQQEHIALFRKHAANRYPGDPITKNLQADIREFLDGHKGMMEVRTQQGELVAAYIYDRLDTGINALHGFFDPDRSTNKTSLGKFALLKLIEHARDKKLNHVYLGYWVKDYPRYQYKGHFHNTEALTEKGWVPFDPKIHTTGPDTRKSIPPGSPSMRIAP